MQQGASLQSPTGTSTGISRDDSVLISPDQHWTLERYMCINMCMEMCIDMCIDM